MPGNLVQAVPTAVLPKMLCTAFREAREYAQLQCQLHDGTIHRSQLAQTSRRTFTLAVRLNSSALATLYSFWVSQRGGLAPFYFYDPFAVAAGQPIGSNYDASGNNTVGRITAVFRGGWSQATDLCRSNVPLQIVEIA